MHPEPQKLSYPAAEREAAGFDSLTFPRLMYRLRAVFLRPLHGYYEWAMRGIFGCAGNSWKPVCQPAWFAHPFDMGWSGNKIIPRSKS